MGKDCNGIDRGRCNKPNCDCIQFVYDKAKGVKCSNCGHVPAKHSAVREGFLVDVTPVSETVYLKDEEASVEAMFEDHSISGIYEDVLAGDIYEEVERDGAHKNNVDSQGTVRGRCTADGCACNGFTHVASRGRKCDVCGHAPVKHIKITEDGHSSSSDWVVVGKPPAFPSPNCNSPERLPSPLKTFSGISLTPSSPPVPSVKRRLQSANSPSDKVAAKQSSSQPTTSHHSQVPKKVRRKGPQPVSAPFDQQTTSLPVQVQSHSALATPPPSLPMSPSGQQICIFPGCSRPVYVESDGSRTHEFCSRTHASEYKGNRPSGK